MRRGKMRNQQYGAASARVKPGARGEPLTPLLRQRVDLEDLDFAPDHGHIAGVAQPSRTARVAVRFLPVGLSLGVATSSAWPSQSKDSGTRYGSPSAEALATQRSTSWVSRCSVSRQR